MKAEDKSCNNCGHHYQNGQRCNARPCRSGDKWKAIAPKPEQPREQEIAETILVDDGSVMGRTMKLSDYNAQFKKIEPKPDTSQVEQTAEEILKQFAKYFNNESYGSIEGWIVEDFVRDELSQYPTINAQSQPKTAAKEPQVDMNKINKAIIGFDVLKYNSDIAMKDTTDAVKESIKEPQVVSASLILGKHIIAYNSQQNDSSKRINLSVAKSQVFEEAMEEYAKENLREEYIQFLDWNKYSTGKRIAELINFDKYLKQKQ